MLTLRNIFLLSPSPPSSVLPKHRSYLQMRCQKSCAVVSLPLRRHSMVSCSRPDSNSRQADLEIDEELDALFDEFGEVVLVNPEARRPQGVEADDESDILRFAVALAASANEVKAAEIKVLHVKPLIYWTRYFVIATAFSRPQIDAIGRRMRDLALEQFNKMPIGGDTKPNSWTLLDFGDVVVHIFLPEERAFYNLEEFYANAASVDLPFTSQAVN